jgi:hypothetical protein
MNRILKLTTINGSLRNFTADNINKIGKYPFLTVYIDEGRVGESIDSYIHISQSQNTSIKSIRITNSTFGVSQALSIISSTNITVADVSITNS